MSQRFDFDFETRYRLAALPFGVTPWTAYVEVDKREFRVRFGPWKLQTTLANIAEVARSSDYAFLKTAGPPHLSFTDRGVSFATNSAAGVCLQLHTPVKGIDPTGRILHPGVTLTLQRIDAFVDLVTP